MKKKIICILLATSIMFARLPLSSHAIETTNVLRAGKSYEIVNVSHDYVIIEVNSEDGYSDFKYDYVEYRDDGRIWFARNVSHSISLSGRSKIRLTVDNIHDVEIRIPTEYQGMVSVSETTTPALCEFTLNKGKNYEIVNHSSDVIEIANNSDYGNGPHYDCVEHRKNDGCIFHVFWLGAFSIDELGMYKLTVGDLDLECWMPYEQKNDISIFETSTPALYIFTLERDKNYKIGNSYRDYIEIKNNSGIGVTDPRFDLRYVDIFGETVNRKDSYGHFEIRSGTQWDIKVGNLEDLVCWMSYDQTSYISGIPVPEGGFIQDTKWPFDIDSTSGPVIVSEYIYDMVDPGETVQLPIAILDNVDDQDSAVSAIRVTAQDMTLEQKDSATGVDKITLFAEEAVAQAASKLIDSGHIVINQENIMELEGVAASVRSAAENALSSEGIVTARVLDTDIKFKTTETENITIEVEPSVLSNVTDNIRVKTPNYEISVPADIIKTNVKDSPLVINITEYNSNTAGLPSPTVMAMASTLGENYGLAGPIVDTDYNTQGKTYKISFNKTLTSNVKVSLPPNTGDPAYQAVIKSNGTAVGGKYNPATGMIDVRMKDSDTYLVKENKKDFTDIQNKSREMQEAIRVLASKGIIAGASSTTFAPDAAITRAEIAALIVRTLSKLDPNADGGFNDVKKSDWFYGAAGSSKRYGIIYGSGEAFMPLVNIPKDQIVAIAARTLRNEMRYKDPTNIEKYLSTYKDRGALPNWSLTDLALATRENLVVKRTDGNFSPTGTMTRGDAAIILYRMFNKIW